MSVGRAASITAPGLHAKAFDADDKNISPYWPSDPALCDLVLEGNITMGNAALLEQKFQTLLGTPHPSTFFLCLRSAGGDLREAVKIAQFVLSTQFPASSIATVIEDGQTCASACAIIFLAGTAPTGGGTWPQRFLHPRGRLLFHSTQLDLSNYPSDKELLARLAQPTTDPRGVKGTIIDIYKDGLRDVQSVIATFQNFIYEWEELGDRWVRPSLFLEMFVQDPDEWLCVDNVDAVGRWNIQVYGYQPPKPPTTQNYSNVCRNAYHWRSDQFAAGAEDSQTKEGELKRPPASTMLAGRNKSNAEFDDRFTMSIQAPYHPLTCVIELNYGHDKKKQLDAELTLTTFFMTSAPFTPSGIAISKLAPTAYYPAATLLRDLPGIRPAPDRGATTTRSGVGFTEYPNTVMNGCSCKSIPKMERAACQAACAADPACQAYSHNKITQACELKHTLTARRLDPLWTSGVPSAGLQPGRSIRAEAMVDYPPIETHIGLPKNVYFVPPREKLRLVEGKLIDEVKVENLEACTHRCESDRMCLALEYYSTGVCRRFSDLTGLRNEPAKKETMTIRIKRQ